MRNTIYILLSGVILGGCLVSEDKDNDISGFITNGSGSDIGTGNVAPAINGNPDDMVMINNMYDFEPKAQDPDGDALIFRIQNKPSWANFDAVTGRLYGQPSLGDIGTYDNIRITVSDGTASDTLKFSVTVTDTALGSVALSWQPPTQNEDGSAITDLAGFKIYYGKNSGQYDNEIDISSPGTTTYVVDNLLPDTYYFAATAYNAGGMESSFSAEAVRSVN